MNVFTGMDTCVFDAVLRLGVTSAAMCDADYPRRTSDLTPAPLAHSPGCAPALTHVTAVENTDAATTIVEAGD